MRTTLLRCTAAVLLFFGMAVSVVPAHASPARPGASPERHCVVHLGVAEKGQRYSPMSDLRCFSSPAEVRAEIAQENARPDIGIQAVLIGTDYTDPNYAGSSLNWTAPGACYYNGTRPSWGAPSMPAGWDNVVSSTRTYSGCKATMLYDYANYGGISMVTGCNSTTLSFMDNRASAREWTDQTYGQPC
ncbi:hypothetical protein [Saccharothrix lopnurensis]|uniref:Peptidase inhibitor family I36 n=1 Tax=Saccharothrix lopnurensis TaxID=1670621 RepID=A0ABW1PC70_9PSEU